MAVKETSTVHTVAKQLGVDGYAVRSILRLGLIPRVRLNHSGYRVLEPWQIDLLQILLGMKQAGFSTRDLRRYSRLFRQGPKTKAERLAMLTTRKHQLHQQISDCERAIDFIERQEEIAQFGREHYHAN